MTGLPVVLDIEHRPCLVVGAGRAGELKIAALQAAGATVTIIDPRAAERPLATTVARRWQPGDSAAMFLTVIATDDAQVNELAAIDATEHGALVLRADRPGDGDLRLPAVFRAGRVTAAIDTGGASPVLAAFLRDQLADKGPLWAELAEWAAADRPVSRDAIEKKFRALTRVTTTKESKSS